MVRKGFIWQLANGLTVAAINLLFVMIMARYIPKEIHGVYAILYVINNFFFMFSQFGMGAALIQKAKIDADDIGRAFYLNLLISFGIYLILFLGAGDISGFFDEKVLASDIRLLGITLLFSSFSSISISLLQRAFRYKQVFFINILSFGLAYLVVGTYLAIKTRDLDAFIYAQLVLQLLLSILAFSVHPFKIKPVALKSGRNKYFTRFGRDYTIIQLMSLTAGKIDKLILVKTVSLEALANFEKAQFLTYLPPRFLNDLSNGFMFAYFSRFQSQNKKLFSSYASVSSLLMLLVAHVAFIFYSLSLLVIELFYGPVWLDIEVYVKIFVFASPFLILAGLSDALVRAKNQFKLAKYLKAGYIIALAGVMLLSVWVDLVYVVAMQAGVSILYGILMNSISLKLMERGHYQYLHYVVPVLVSAVLFFAYYLLYIETFSNSNSLVSLVIAEFVIVLTLLVFNKYIFSSEQRKLILSLIKWKS